jgi:hypothetical protein
MRTRFWVSSLVLAACLCTSAAESVHLASGKTITYTSSSGSTFFLIPKPNGGTSRLSVQRDGTVAQDSTPTSVKLVAEPSISTVILIDTYPSIPGGMSYCQAGEERFLRVLDISGRRPYETFHLKLESCRENIELASPGLKWSPETSSLSIRWLSAPGHIGKAEDRTLKIRAKGKVS